MKTIAGRRSFSVGALCTVMSAAAQTPVGALAIDENQGERAGGASA